MLLVAEMRTEGKASGLCCEERLGACIKAFLGRLWLWGMESGYPGLRLVISCIS